MGKSLNVAQAELQQAIEAVQNAMAGVDAYLCMVSVGINLDPRALLALQTAVVRLRSKCEAMVLLRLAHGTGTDSHQIN